MLFLYGIIPDTGSLAITASNERYQDYQTCFPTSEWSFNYQNSSIRIPVMAGNLTFIFGSQNVTQSFPSNGVYDVQFASDWNSVSAINKVANINVPTLQPVTLQPVAHPTPTATPNPTPTAKIPTPSPTPTPTSTPNNKTPTPTPTNQLTINYSNPTSKPNPTPTSTQQSTATPNPPPQSQPQMSNLIFAVSSATLVMTVAEVYLVRKNRVRNS